MKRIATGFSILGIASGVAFVLGPWIFGVRDLAAASYVLPAAFGALLIIAHWLTLRWFRSSSPKRAGLLTLNITLLVIAALGFQYVLANPAGSDRSLARVALLAVLFLAPLVSNVLYLAIRRISVER
jgi:hypothetical protein